MSLGEKIRFLRNQKGWSQERLAEELSVSRQALSKWEQGTSVPDTVNVWKLSQLFSVSTDYLLDDSRGVEKATSTEDSARAVIDAAKLSHGTKRLLAERGPAACYLLAGRCIFPLLLLCGICYAYLSVLSQVAPLTEFPIQAFIFPVIAGILAVLFLVRITVYLLLAFRLKRSGKTDKLS